MKANKALKKRQAVTNKTRVAYARRQGKKMSKGT